MAKQVKSLIQEDNGWKSRKLWFAVGCVWSLFGAAIVFSRNAATVPMYETFVGGVIAICGLLFTGSVANKFVAIKAAQKPASEVKEVTDQDIVSD